MRLTHVLGLLSIVPVLASSTCYATHNEDIVSEYEKKRNDFKDFYPNILHSFYSELITSYYVARNEDYLSLRRSILSSLAADASRLRTLAQSVDLMGNQQATSPSELTSNRENLNVFNNHLDPLSKRLSVAKEDLMSLTESYRNQCSAEKITWVEEIFDPGRLFIDELRSTELIFSPGNSHFSVQFPMSDSSQSLHHERQILTGSQITAGTACTLGGMAIGQLSSGGSLSGLVAKGALTKGGAIGGLAGAAAAFVADFIFSLIWGENTGALVDRRNDLLAEIRNIQFDHLKSETEHSKELIEEICKKYSIPEYELALQRNSAEVERLERSARTLRITLDTLISENSLELQHQIAANLQIHLPRVSGVFLEKLNSYKDVISDLNRTIKRAIEDNNLGSTRVRTITEKSRVDPVGATDLKYLLLIDAIRLDAEHHSNKEFVLQDHSAKDPVKDYWWWYYRLLQRSFET